MSAEIKFNIDLNRVPQAIGVLGLSRRRPTWQVLFAEDTATGLTPATPLLDHGIVIRARVKPDRRCDCTVKLRPCRPSQFSKRWWRAADRRDSGLKIEQDWSQSGRLLAASLTVNVRRSRLREAHHSRKPLTEILSQDQRRLLDECAAIPIHLDRLHFLKSAVTSTRWDKVELPGIPDGEIRAERWVLNGTNMLELSCVGAAGNQAERVQNRMRNVLHELGLPVDNGATKTGNILLSLVAAD